MKIITLNTWGGRAGRKGLLDFFDTYRDSDVFCLQEVWSAPYEHLEGTPMGGLVTSNTEVMTEGMQDVSKVLSEHTSLFHPHHLDNYGLQMLIKKDIPIIESGDVFVHKERGHIPEGDVGECARNVQYATLKTKEGSLTIINFHGLWTSKEAGKGKRDIPERIEQSNNIVRCIKGFKTPVVFCGDFNLLPTTESIKVLESAGLRNLITEYGITSTRTSFYKKPEKYADYVMVSPRIDVKDFKVLPEEVSDHAPLFLECALETGG